MLRPKSIKYRKPHRGRLTGNASCGTTVVFGHYGIRSVQPSWITSRQIESGRRVLIRYVRRTGKLWIRIFPDKPITARPAETRIGSGKGTCAYWVAVVRPGIIIFEFTGITKRIGIQATKVVGSKFSAGVCLVTKKLNLYD
jgi:large subunit ribosomal protein L16